MKLQNCLMAKGACWKLWMQLGTWDADFYSLLKEKRIVILGDCPMTKGD